MHTVFRLFLVLVCAAFIAACATYSSTYVYGPPPVPEPPAAPKMEMPEPPAAPQLELPEASAASQMELPELPAAPEVEPPAPPSPGLPPKHGLIRVDVSGRTDIDSSTLTITLGEYTYSIGADGTWELISAPMGVQPAVVEFSIRLR